MRDSSIHGRGVFAAAPIPESTVLGQYPGRLRTPEQMVTRRPTTRAESSAHTHTHTCTTSRLFGPEDPETPGHPAPPLMGLIPGTLTSHSYVPNPFCLSTKEGRKAFYLHGGGIISRTALVHTRTHAPMHTIPARAAELLEAALNLTSAPGGDRRRSRRRLRQGRRGTVS